MRHFKSQTERSAIIEIPAPEQVIIPLLQHIGSPAEPKVQIGDIVKLGQVIGSADAFVTASVHASVSGKVLAIEPRIHPNGMLIRSVVIQNDGLDTLDESCKPYLALEQLGAHEIVDAVKKAGIVGMGGATFPTHVKLQPPKDKHVDTLILNAAECEPYLTADHRLLLENTGDVLLGLQAEAKALNVKQVFIGIEDNKLDAVKKLKEAGAEKFAKIKILKTKYPTGAEKVLVSKITGRKVPPLGLPLDVGCVVTNVGTVVQIAKTLRTGLPLIDRIVTIAGDVENPGNYKVRLGTPLKVILKTKEDLMSSSKQYKLLMGGPMMGIAQSSLDIPVLKGS